MLNLMIEIAGLPVENFREQVIDDALGGLFHRDAVSRSLTEAIFPLRQERGPFDLNALSAAVIRNK